MLLVETRKGQASVEMLITVGVVLAFVVPLILFILSISNYNYENVSKYQADVSAEAIAHIINHVFIEGEGSQRSILVNLPSNTKSLEINQNEVIITLETSAGIYQASYPLLTDILSEIKIDDRAGLFWLKITNNGEFEEIGVTGWIKN